MTKISEDSVTLPSANGQERLIDIAYRTIKDGIVRGSLAPGSMVTESSIDGLYEVGKASVRAALMQLARERLVTPHPRRGYEISDVRLRDVYELFQLRFLLEPETARLAMGRLDVNHLAELDKVCASGFGPGDVETQSRLIEANHRFHLTYILACGNERLCSILIEIMEQMKRLFYLGLSTSPNSVEMRKQHVDLVQAFRSGDADGAERLVKAHIGSMRQTVLDGLLRVPHIVDARIHPISDQPAKGGPKLTRSNRAPSSVV
jgi:DNA-binding GntR family transcriptional regulator